MTDDEPGEATGIDPEPGNRYQRYQWQRRNRGLAPTTWGEWQRAGQPLYDDDHPTTNRQENQP